MKKMISLALSLALILVCLSSLAFATDTVPSQAGKPIAKVTTGSTTVECANFTELAAAVDASGNSVVTILQDFYYDGKAMDLPYSCTIDFDGHTVTGGVGDKYDAFQVLAAGSANNITTIKNGTLLYNRFGLRILENAGGFVASNMVICGNAEGISPDDFHFKGESLVENCLIIGKEWGAICFNVKGDCSGHNITVKDSTLVSMNKSGCVLMDIGFPEAVGGSFTLGTGVKMYVNKVPSFHSTSVTVTGEAPTKNAAPQTFENAELGLKMENMTLFETAPTPVQPAAPAEPTVPSTPVPDVEVPKTGASVAVLSILAAVSMAGAAMTSRKEN